MKSPKVVFVCQECGAQAPKWMGRCAECGAWNSFVEERAETPAAPGAGTTNRFAQFSTSPCEGCHMPFATCPRSRAKLS